MIMKLLVPKRFGGGGREFLDQHSDYRLVRKYFVSGNRLLLFCERDKTLMF
jgi:hypothetical protein